MSAEIKDCYLTKEDLLKTLGMEHDVAIRGYCRGIQTLQDLVRFCYSRNLSKDLIAKRAAEIRAKELLEMNLSE